MSDVDSASENTENTSESLEDQAFIPHFDKNTHLEIVDGEGNVMAYAVCQDSEPPIPEHFKSSPVGSFKEVQFKAMQKSWESTILPATHIYSTQWKTLKGPARKLPNLCKKNKRKLGSSLSSIFFVPCLFWCWLWLNFDDCAHVHMQST